MGYHYTPITIVKILTLVRIQRSTLTQMFLVGMEYGTVTLEDGLALSYKIKCTLNR